MDGNTESSHLTRVRRTIVRIQEDARLLRQHRPDRSDDRRTAVGEQELDERVEQLEQEVASLRDHIQEE